MGTFIIVTLLWSVFRAPSFSDLGNLVEYQKLPANMRWYVEGYCDMISEVQIADAEENFKDCAEWADLLEQRLTTNTKDQQIILSQLQWGQGEDFNPNYNMYSPVVTHNGQAYHCPVGCVALAMAQICKYYAFPKKPTGRKNHNWHGTALSLYYDTMYFDYSLMPNYGLTTTSTTEQKRETSKLCYALGVSVNMDFDWDGSGAYSQDVPYAMNGYFRPASTNGADTIWLRKHRDDLIGNRLVYMSGASSTGSGSDAAGHAWVCAGYMRDTESKYFMNWGWEGGGNGFYNLKTNNMPIQYYGYNFNQRQGHIVNMTPPSNDSTDVPFVGIPTVEDRTELGVAYPNPATISVSLPYTATSATELEVYGIDGKVVLTRSLPAGRGAARVNVSDMPAGIYIYRIGGETGKFMVR